MLPDLPEPVPFELRHERVPLGAAVSFTVGRGNQLPPCFQLAVVGPDGEARLHRADHPRYRGAYSGPNPPETAWVVQDWAALDEVGTWTLEFTLADAFCGEVEPARHTRVVEVVAPAVPVGSRTRAWSSVGIPRNRAVLLDLAQQGVPGAAHALAGIPDPGATDALIALLDHPIAEVVQAAADGLAVRVPRPQIPGDAPWSEATWRPEHLPAVTAWLARTDPEARAHRRLAGSVACLDAAPTLTCQNRR